MHNGQYTSLGNLILFGKTVLYSPGGAYGCFACLYGFSLIVVLFTLSSGNTDFYVFAPGKDFERNNCSALMLKLQELIDFAALGKEFSCTSLVTV